MRKEPVERNRTRCMGIQSVVLVSLSEGPEVIGIPEAAGKHGLRARDRLRAGYRRCAIGRGDWRKGERDEAGAGPHLRAKSSRGANERSSHDESIPSMGSGGTISMVIISPM